MEIAQSLYNRRPYRYRSIEHQRLAMPSLSCRVHVWMYCGEEDAPSYLASGTATASPISVVTDACEAACTMHPSLPFLKDCAHGFGLEYLTQRISNGHSERQLVVL